MKNLKSNVFGVILSVVVELSVLLGLLYYKDPSFLYKGLGILLLIYIFYLLNKKLVLPTSLSAIFHIHIFLTLLLGATFDFYNHLWWWDLFVHGLFGMVGSIVAYYLIVRKSYKKFLSTFMILFIMGTTAMAGAAIWEIIEYTLDKIFKTNFQHGIVEIGYPLDDTMWDIIITLIGVCITDIIYLIDLKKNNSKLINWFTRDFEKNILF